MLLRTIGGEEISCSRVVGHVIVVLSFVSSPCLFVTTTAGASLSHPLFLQFLYNNFIIILIDSKHCRLLLARPIYG